MSCNGCRVLRKGCSENCTLRSSLKSIDSAEAQGHATMFVAKFFGRAGLMSFISNVSEKERPALFQSLLYEACGRTVNPVYGAVGLLCSGNWHICEAAVESVLRGGTLTPLASVPPMMPLASFSQWSRHSRHEMDLPTAEQKRKFDEHQKLRYYSFAQKKSRIICVSKPEFKSQEEERKMQPVSAGIPSRSSIFEGLNDASLSLSLPTAPDEAIFSNSDNVELDLSLSSRHTVTRPGAARMSSPTSVVSVTSESSVTSFDTVDPPTSQRVIPPFPTEEIKLLDLLV